MVCLLDLRTKCQRQSAITQTPKTKNALPNPETPTSKPKHRYQWHFIRWPFVHGQSKPE